MDFASLHELLRSTYDEMMPLCAQMTGIAKGIAGLGALFYIALRVWASIARAEAIDVFPLLRPFVLGFLYHVLSDSRTGYDECRSLAHSAGNGDDGTPAGGEPCRAYCQARQVARGSLP